MAKVKKSTKNKLTKQIGKIVKKHGPEIAMGLATGIVSTMFGDVDEKGKKKSKSSTKKSDSKKDSGKKSDSKKDSGKKASSKKDSSKKDSSKKSTKSKSASAKSKK